MSSSLTALDSACSGNSVEQRWPWLRPAPPDSPPPRPPDHPSHPPRGSRPGSVLVLAATTADQHLRPFASHRPHLAAGSRGEGHRGEGSRGAPAPSSVRAPTQAQATFPEPPPLPKTSRKPSTQRKGNETFLLIPYYECSLFALQLHQRVHTHTGVCKGTHTHRHTGALPKG